MEIYCSLQSYGLSAWCTVERNLKHGPREWSLGNRFSGFKRKKCTYHQNRSGESSTRRLQTLPAVTSVKGRSQSLAFTLIQIEPATCIRASRNNKRASYWKWSFHYNSSQKKQTFSTTCHSSSASRLLLFSLVLLFCNQHYNLFGSPHTNTLATIVKSVFVKVH